MKNKLNVIFASFFSVLLFISAISGQIASGGDFTLEQDVIAGGGNEASDATGTLLKIEGTTGQNAVGTIFDGGNFVLFGGFWHSPELAPTAAGVTISGRVVLNLNQKQNPGKMQGLPNAILILTGGMMTAPRVAQTNPFGNFTFEGIEPGHFYVLRVRHREYQFSDDTLAFTLMDNLSNVIFRADSSR